MGADEFLGGRLFQNETPAAVVILYEVFSTFRQIHTYGSAMRISHWLCFLNNLEVSVHS